ncbi:Putative reactive intermediate deaminase TdcF [Variovorax sp. SRS16]|uniref:RidA family protein n=1 Tax=Variovorax sp. SRS16 TaxID=282217 RepID=UPI0013197538|nr:RidA family protein [Variovorax sp. SRS16]VTU24087.1 Putative reactive intermediate deaminase TdcF [Variovorax sp. SRS16]
MAGDDAALPGSSPGPVPVEVPSLAEPGGHYSHACTGGGWVFISGQLPIAPDGTRRVDASFEDQAVQVLANVREALLAAGSGVDRLVQVRVYVDDIANWPAFDRLYRQWAGSSRPARAVIPTGSLHFGLKVEMEATALL